MRGRLPLLLALVLVAGCPTNESAAPAPTQPVEVTPVSLERRAIARELVLPVELWAWQRVSIVAKVTGYIERVPVDRGSKVRDGDLLATIRAPELDDDRRKRLADVNVAKAELASARADLELQEVTAKRIANLAREHAVSVQELDEARARELVARARIEQADAKLASAQESLRATETWLTYTTVAAPFTGTVTERWVHPGSFVSAAERTPLFEVLDRSTIRAVIDVPEADSTLVKVGETEVRVLLKELGAPRAGRVSRAAAALDPKTRTLRIEADLVNGDDRLVPGMYGHASLVLEKHTNAAVLPRTAIARGDAPAVFVVVGDKVARRPVTVGLEDQGGVEIVAGLDGSEAVARDARGLLDGMPVKVVAKKETR